MNGDVGTPPKTLREVRRERSAFEPRFFERSDLFAPIARAARVFADLNDWPRAEEYGRAFVGPGPVTFSASAPRPRRRAEPRKREELYDAVIVERRVVPTRERMWHDFLNALVWATFPRAKLALHTRQHRAIQAWVPAGATKHPNARTRELDALALVDEGGVVVLRSASEEATLIFGHALYEGLVLENRAMISRAVVFEVSRMPLTLAERVVLADELLAGALEDPRFCSRPEDLPRRPLSAEPRALTAPLP